MKNPPKKSVQLFSKLALSHTFRESFYGFIFISDHRCLFVYYLRTKE